VGRTAELFHVAAQIYTSEREREPPIYPLLGALLGVNFKAAVEAYKVKTRQRATVADALFHAVAEIEDTTFGKKKAVAVYVELENELGVRGDGGLQAALFLRKHITQEDVKSFMMTLNILSLTIVDCSTSKSGTSLVVLVSSSLSLVPISRSLEQSSPTCSLSRVSLTMFSWAGILMRGRRSSMSPRFSMLPPKQCARYNNTTSFYV